MKAIVNIKGSDGNIWEVFEVLDGVRRAIFRDTVFGYFIDVPRLQGDTLLFHKMFLDQIRPDPVLSPDGIKRLYFRVGNTKMVYGPEEFCLITGFNFGEYPKNIVKKALEKLLTSKKRCLLRERLFPDHTNSSVKIGDLKRLILNRTFIELDDVDAVREGQPPRQNMLPSDGEMTSCYYMSFQEYVYGEGKAVPSPVRDHFRRQDESSSSMSSSDRSHGRGRGSGKHNLDEVLKWLHAPEQHVFLNRQPTEVFVEEVNTEQFWNDITFDDPIASQRKYDKQVLEERNDYAGNKFDDDVFDVNDYSEVKEESEERNDNAGNKFDDDVFDVNDYNEAKERFKHLNIVFSCTQHRSKKRRAKKKVDIKSTIPVPPPAFGVAHDFSMLRLQPYVARGEVVIQNYLFHSYDVQHRLFNFVLDRDFWSSLFGHTHDGWLESSDWRAFMAGIATYPNFMVAWWDVDTVNLIVYIENNIVIFVMFLYFDLRNIILFFDTMLPNLDTMLKYKWTPHIP
uniref:Uncharacterized protein n=1 Tax=Lactuca sativa TaxID=4236 RepID=A0A9R1X742_LACSA|nr:hypothetical protein LSAT_V11C600337270 [Lactuca sativa]